MYIINLLQGPSYSAFLHYRTREAREACLRDEEILTIRDCYCVPEPAHDPIYLILRNLDLSIDWNELINEFKKKLIPALEDPEPIDETIYEVGWDIGALKFCNKTYCSKAHDIIDGYRSGSIVIRAEINTQRNLDSIIAEKYITQVCVTGLSDVTTPAVLFI